MFYSIFSASSVLDFLMRGFLEESVPSSEKILRKSMVSQICFGAGEERMMICTQGSNFRRLQNLSQSTHNKE